MHRAKKLEVILGMHNWLEEQPEPIVELVRKIIIHPEYNPRTVSGIIKPC